MTNEEAKNWLGLEIEIWEAECKSIHPTKDALKVAIEALEKLEQRCGNCTYHDELNFHKSSLNPNDCWCSKRHIYTYADMNCSDWSEEK